MCAYRWDLKTNIITRAKESSTHPGFHDHSDSWMYREGLEHVHLDDRERVITAIELAINTYKEFNIEFRARLPGEGIRWMLTRGHAIYGDHGVALEVFAVTQEITERKETELRLDAQKRELEIKKRQLDVTLESAGMIALTEIRDHTRYKSAELCRLYGIENEDTLLSRDLLISKLHPEDRERVRSQIEETDMNGGSICDEHRILLSNGEIHWALIKGIHLKDSDGCGDFVIIQDITSQKNAQDEIAQKKKQLSIISNHMPQLAWISDNSGALTWVNERFVEFSGIAYSELLGFGYLKLHNSDFREINLKRIRNNIGMGLPWEETFQLLGRNHEWRWFLSRAEPVRDSQQQIVNWVGTNTDVTEKWELTKNLESQKLLREEFTSTLTHDLRNPLSVISMSVQLALEEKAGNKTIDTHLNRALATVQRMDRMIEDLLSANLLNAGERISFEMEYFDVQMLIFEILDEFELKFGSRFIFVNPGELHGYWNREALRRVIENLLTNAIKYGEPSSKVTLILQRLELETGLTFEVHNYGPVIPASDLTHIFDIHKRARVQEHKKKIGWGIGLTLVRGIVAAHGGSVSVTSDELKGTVFKVTLPLEGKNRD